MAVTFGITTFSPTGANLLISVDVDHQSELKQLLTATGDFFDSRTVDDSYKVTIKGHGDLSNAYITGFFQFNDTAKPAGVAGRFIVNSVKETQTNEDWPTWEYSGTSYPHLA